MSGILLAIIVIAWFVTGYFVYGKFIERKLINPDDSKPTPAVRLRDDVDFSPAKKPLLFGHHFSSIAGAGPIVGPLIGVMYFGWLFAVLWISLGTILMGAVHDYTALMVSVRNDGKSMGDIAEKTISPAAKITFSIFVWITLVFIVAVFGVVTADTFIKRPEIVIPTFSLIFIAMIFGFLVYRLNFNIVLGTVIAMLLLVLSVYLGELFPVKLPAKVLGMSSDTFWFWILMVYSFFASVLPVWFLLQPRDYLSMWILILGLALGFIGVFFYSPSINAPMVAKFSGEKGPLWPMLFVIIACGALSGFHSLVAGGTTSKQLAKESHGRLIGYGGMVMEGVLALLVLIIAAGVLKWDPMKKDLVLGFQYLMDQKVHNGPPVAFATGYGKMVGAIPGFTVIAGMYFGMIMLNAFVITSLDTSTRLARFIVNELFGKKIKLLNGRFLATALTIGVAAYFGATKGYKHLWTLFGASNQLVGSLSLLVITSYFVGVKKPKKYTLIPGLFMLVTTVSALIYQLYVAVTKKDFQIVVVAFILIVLAVFIFIQSFPKIFPKSEKV